LNSDDPLYDEEEKGGAQYVLSSSNHSSSNGNKAVVEDVSRPVYGPMLTISEFKIQVVESLREYFQSSDTSEFLRSLEELKCAEYHAEVIKKAVHLACDAGPRERELTSRLLTELHPMLLNDEDIATGFEHLLESMDDMVIDIPDANTLVGAFLARAVVDEVLPPAFLSNRECKENSCVELAVRLLSREHCTARLEKVWGPGDGRPVEELKTSIDQLLKEYLLSRELDEAARCVRELQVPHFHHELIKRGIKIAMEEDGANTNHNVGAEEDASVDAMAALFLFLIDNSILSENQLKKGLCKVKDSLDDISLDVPDAPMILKEFEELLLKK
jgi:programmed cell death protein 4